MACWRNLFLLVQFVASLNAYGSDARSYVLVPVDTNLAEFRFAKSVTVTPSQPTDIRIGSQTTSLKLTHYYDFFGTMAAVQVTAPFSRLRYQGIADLTASGMSDSSVLFGFGLYNMPALSGDKYYQFNSNGFSAAGSVMLTAPSGEYDKNKILNAGSNRQSRRFEIQGAWREDRLLLEFLGGFTQYDANSEYLASNRLGQKRLAHVETHFSYNFTPRLWVSLDALVFRGGETVLNDTNMSNPQRSLIGGVMAGYALDHKQLIKWVYQKTISSSSISTRFEGLAIGYMYAF